MLHGLTYPEVRHSEALHPFLLMMTMACRMFQHRWEAHRRLS
ncbi:hypothetical protein [Romeriopsis navalis]|nr:hypothetical protein [Romeriopsis navalis]